MTFAYFIKNIKRRVFYLLYIHITFSIFFQFSLFFVYNTIWIEIVYRMTQITWIINLRLSNNLNNFFFQFWFMSQFKSLKIKNDLQHDFDKLFQHISRTSYDIFNLFFIEIFFQKLINYINQQICSKFFQKNFFTKNFKIRFAFDKIAKIYISQLFCDFNDFAF